jgi:transcriptional regulator with XRE-family HTH domain
MKSTPQLHQTLRARRIALGLTQQECAHRARISLATLQNLEAGKGNPCLSVLSTLCPALTLELEIRPETVHWEVLAALGAPLLETAPLAPPSPKPSPERLIQELPAACADGARTPRQTEALQGLLLALQLHYPQFFARHLGRIPAVTALTPRVWTGRQIQLKRLALATLGSYL